MRGRQDPLSPADPAPDSLIATLLQSNLSPVQPLETALHPGRTLFLLLNHSVSARRRSMVMNLEDRSIKATLAPEALDAMFQQSAGNGLAGQEGVAA